MNLTYDLRNEVRQMPSDLTSRQMRLILDKYPPPCVKLRKHSVKSILVVERTFSWLRGRRRINCNYEQFLHTATHMITASCMMFMLRYI